MEVGAEPRDGPPVRELPSPLVPGELGLNERLQLLQRRCLPRAPGQWDRSLAGQSGSAAPSRCPVGSRPAALPGSATSSKSLAAAEPETGGIDVGSSVGTRWGAGSGSVKRLGVRPLHARTNGVSVPKWPTHLDWT